MHSGFGWANTAAVVWWEPLGTVASVGVLRGDVEVGRADALQSAQLAEFLGNTS